MKLTYAGIKLLSVLRNLYGKSQLVNTTKLCRYADVTKQHGCPILQQMEREGYIIRRRRNKIDQRTEFGGAGCRNLCKTAKWDLLVFITDKGLKLINEHVRESVVCRI